MSQTRNFVFTANNGDAATYEGYLESWGAVKYFVFGEEVGEKEETPHLQGYVELKDKAKWTTIHNKVPAAHVEPRKATAKRASDYCKKGEQPKEEWDRLQERGPNFGLNARVTEKGVLSNPGKRTDLDNVAEMVKDGKKLRTIAQDHPATYIRYHKGITALKMILIEPRNEVPEVRVFIGESGKGKSKAAREWLEEDFYVWHPQQEKWFDGYEGQRKVIFEEFRGQLPFGMLLSLLDRYDCKIQYKGGVCEFAATKIAITSPIHPDFWYVLADKHDKLAQLQRRITEVIEL